MPEHPIMECERWSTIRNEVKQQVGNKLSTVDISVKKRDGSHFEAIRKIIKRWCSEKFTLVQIIFIIPQAQKNVNAMCIK